MHAIRNIIIIIVILLVVFFGQQAYSNLKTGSSDPGYLTKGSSWLKDSVLPKIGGEVQKRGDMIKEEIQTEKEKISETIGEKLKNYFTGVVDSVFNPGKVNQTQNQNCNCSEDSQTQPILTP